MRRGDGRNGMTRKRPVHTPAEWFASGVILAALALLIVYPGLSVLQESLFPNGAWSLEKWRDLAFDPYYRKIIVQSLPVSMGSAALSTLLGLLLATTAARTRAPLRKLFTAAAVLPIIIPGYVNSIAYIFLFGRNGLLTYKLFGWTWDVYSWKSVFLLQSVDQTTTAFLLILSGYLAMDGEAEDAARSLGAGEWRILGTVTLPLAAPLCLAALLLNFMRAMSDFGTPLVVGGAYDTPASASYNALIGSYDLGMAAALNTVLLVICLLAYAGFSRLQKRHEKTRMEVRAGGGRVSPGGVWAVSCWCACLLFSLFVFALLAAVFLAAFTHSMGGDLSFTLEHFRAVSTRGAQSARNTLLFAAAVGGGVAFFGQALAYATTRLNLPGKRLMDLPATIPFALPGTFVGVGYAIAFNKPPLLLTGTWTIVVLNLVIRKLPLGFRAGAAILSRQDRSVEEASTVLGASTAGTFFTIIIPMAKSAMIAGGLYAFVSAVQALGSIIFIITPGTKLLSIDVFEAVVRGEPGHAAAFSTVMLVLAAAGGGLILLMSGARKPLRRKT